MKKLLLLVTAVFIGWSVSAQVTTSGISGTVTDANGAPLVGTTVIATHIPSGTQYGAAADAKGNYRIYNVRPGGPYTITFSMIGYQTVEKTGIELALAETNTTDAFLNEDAIGVEAVVVSADGKGSSMSSERAGAVTNVTREGIDLTPAVSRSMNDIMRLSPQSNSTTNGFAVGGGNYRQSYVTVDGAAFNNAFGIGQNLPANGSPISLDALEQISVAVTPFDVRQSGFTGGAINAVTRSGDNEFRGTAYTFLKNNKLRGDRVGDGKVNVEDAHTYTYGASLGGAIVQNKLFFFVNGEYEDEITAGPNGVPSKDGTAFGDNNVKRPTVEDMETMRNFLKKTYNYDPGRYMNYSIKTPGYKIMARVDWNISDNHKLNVRFSRTHTKDSSGPSSSTSPLYAQNIYPGGAGVSNGQGRLTDYAMYFESQRYYTIRDFTSVAAELNSRFLNGRLNNTLRYAYSYQHEPREYEGGPFPTVDILKDGACYMSFGPDPFTEGNLREVSTHVITDEISYNAGINNLTAGVQFEHNDATNGFMQAGNGYYVFSSMNDFMTGAKPSAFGIMHSNQANLDQFLAKMQYQQFSFYLQDELSIHKNFKLTAGLRFEVPIYPSLENNFNKAYADLDFGGKHYSTDQVPDSRLTVSPRLGFNWDITGERKYILRGGTGYFVGRLPFVWLVSAVGNSNVGQTSYYYDSVDKVPTGGVQPGFHTNVGDLLHELYPNGFDPTTPTAPSSPTIIDKDLKMPAVWKTSLAFDANLPGNIDFTLEGIYSHDYNPAVISNMNYKPSNNRQEIIPGSGDVREVVMDWNGDPTNSKNGTYNSKQCYYITNGDKGAYYYSITAQLRKRFAFGLNVSFAYTHSKARSYGDGIGDQVTSAYKTNTYSQGMINSHELGYGTYVAPDRILLTLNYRKEYGRNFATNVGLVYEGSQIGFAGGYSYSRYSYTFSGNVVGDGGANSLLFVPKSREDLEKWDFIDIVDKKTGNVTYSAKDQKDDFWAYINQDDYLKTRKGKYAERGGAVMPWHHQVDLHFGQEFFIKTKSGKRNTLEIGVDIENLPNLLSKDWGLYKEVKNPSLISVVSHKDEPTGKTIFDGYAYAKYNKQRNTTTYRDYENLWSTYRVMFSLRYRFN